MGNINIEDLQPGLVLSGDVKDRSGTVILASGTPPLPRHGQILQRCEITLDTTVGKGTTFNGIRAQSGAEWVVNGD